MNFNSSEMARIAVFAALYSIAGLVPISMFIGADSFLSLNIVITPLIAILLLPKEAFVSSLTGGVITLFLVPSQAIFGPFSILLPIVGATFGSLTFHKSKLSFLASVYLIFVIFLYLIARPEFPYWISLHLFAAIIAIMGSFKGLSKRKLRIPLSAIVCTMCEQGTMLIGAVYILNLPWEVFATAFPLLIYERTIAIVVGSVIAFTVIRRFSNTNKASS